MKKDGVSWLVKRQFCCCIYRPSSKSRKIKVIMRGMLIERIHFNPSTGPSNKGSDWIYILIYFNVNRLVMQIHTVMYVYGFANPMKLSTISYQAKLFGSVGLDLASIELETSSLDWNHACFLKISCVGTCQRPMLTRCGGWIWGG